MDFAAYRTPASDSARAIAESAKIGLTVKDATVFNPGTPVVSIYALKTKPGFNCRVDESPRNIESIRKLAEQFAEMPVDDKGCINVDPLRVWEEDGDVFISNGNRRIAGMWLANDELGASIKNVRIIKGPKDETTLDRLVYQSTLNDQFPTSAYEQGKNYIAIRNESGLSSVQIGRLVSRSHTHIDNCMGLHDLPESIQKLIRLDRVSDKVAAQAYRDAEGNEADALAIIEGAMEAAEEEGGEGKKATAKHVKKAGEKKVNPMAEIAALLGASTLVPRYGENEAGVEAESGEVLEYVMYLDPEDKAKIWAFLGLDKDAVA